jgi:hypothetical protein
MKRSINHALVASSFEPGQVWRLSPPSWMTA